MKNTALLLAFVFITSFSFAQVKSPMQWSFSCKKIDANTYEIHLTAKLDVGWHTYSQTTPDGGPVPTRIEFTKNPLLALQGSVKDVGKLERHHEELFGVDVKQFSNKVDFVQTVKIKGKVKTSVNGNVEYMTCNDRECLPPSKQTFSIALQ